MKVFVIHEQVHHAFEWGEVLGVFETQEKAIDFVREDNKTHCHFTENGGDVELEDDGGVKDIGREIYIQEWEVK